MKTNVTVTEKGQLLINNKPAWKCSHQETADAAKGLGIDTKGLKQNDISAKVKKYLSAPKRVEPVEKKEKKKVEKKQVHGDKIENEYQIGDNIKFTPFSKKDEVEGNIFRFGKDKKGNVYAGIKLKNGKESFKRIDKIKFA